MLRTRVTGWALVALMAMSLAPWAALAAPAGTDLLHRHASVEHHPTRRAAVRPVAAATGSGWIAPGRVPVGVAAGPVPDSTAPRPPRSVFVPPRS